MLSRTIPLFALSLGCAAFAQSPPAMRGLTFHAGFNGSTDAAVAKGDKRIYTAINYKAQGEAKPGLGNPEVELAPGAGVAGGGALRFKKKNTHAIFYQGEGNVAFKPDNWTGTISFWLRLDPDKELEPGFCDPIQVTDKSYDNSAIWVDFTKDDKPRHFRLGVFGDLGAWNPEKLATDKTPKFFSRLAVVRQAPFRADKWVNVAITHSRLGSGQGSAALFLDGVKVGEATAIAERFEWDMKKAALRVGVNYVGLFDEFSVFDRVLSEGDLKKLASAASR